MRLGLEGAHIAIAGASDGIGLGVARAFREEGAMPWLTGRSADRLAAASAALDGAPFTIGDLTEKDARIRLVEEITERWGRLDVLVLNFGETATPHPGLVSTDDEWLRLFHANFLAHVALLRECSPLLGASERAAVVALSSIAGEMRLPAPLAYSTAKAALNHLCVSIAPELARAGIRFNVVSPGNVRYPGGRWDKRVAEQPEATNRMLEESVPLRRLGTPDDIAAFVVFLASERASFCTGAIINVDGGQSRLA